MRGGGDLCAAQCSLSAPPPRSAGLDLLPRPLGSHGQSDSPDALAEAPAGVPECSHVRPDKGSGRRRRWAGCRCCRCGCRWSPARPSHRSGCSGRRRHVCVIGRALRAAAATAQPAAHASGGLSGLAATAASGTSCAADASCATQADARSTSQVHMGSAMRWGRLCGGPTGPAVKLHTSRHAQAICSPL